MNYLGIDYGRKKIGVAFSAGLLAEPYLVIRYENPEILYAKFGEIIKTLEVECLVVGVSEGDMGQESMNFGKNISEKLSIQVVFQDETLSTKDANRMSIESGKKQKKRREMEDAYAATVMLQSYLDS
jgi:putative holliday junction resolvase